MEGGGREEGQRSPLLVGKAHRLLVEHSAAQLALPLHRGLLPPLLLRNRQKLRQRVLPLLLPLFLSSSSSFYSPF